METAITVVHFLVTLLIVGLILLQQGKGAQLGASFGTGSQSVLGTTGGASLFSRLTSALAVVFFITSLGLAIYAKQQSQSIAVDIPDSIVESAESATEATLTESAQSGATDNNTEAAVSEPEEFDFDQFIQQGEQSGDTVE